MYIPGVNLSHPEVYPGVNLSHPEVYPGRTMRNSLSPTVIAGSRPFVYPISHNSHPQRTEHQRENLLTTVALLRTLGEGEGPTHGVSPS